MGFFNLIFNLFLLFILYKAGVLLWNLLSPPNANQKQQVEEDPFFKIDKSKAEDINFEEIEEE